MEKEKKTVISKNWSFRGRESGDIKKRRYLDTRLERDYRKDKSQFVQQ